MLRFLNPFGGKDVWLTPGGGIDSGEDDLAALHREVWEETGLRLPNDLPLIWRRVHTYPLRGEQVRQSEDIYFARVARFAPTSANNPAQGEVDIFREFRWWSLDEIRASRELFVPKGFADLTVRERKDPRRPTSRAWLAVLRLRGRPTTVPDHTHGVPRQARAERVPR